MWNVWAAAVKVFVCAITMVCNDADVIGATTRHLLSQGVDRILIADHGSAVKAADQLSDLVREHPDRVTISRVNDPGFSYPMQSRRVTELAARAAALGAKWVIPFDADEWWVPARERAALRKVLEDLEPNVHVLLCPWIRHVSWDRHPDPEPLVKVAFTAHPSAVVWPGAHGVSHPFSHSVRRDRIVVREIPFRSEDHFVAKIRARAKRLPVRTSYPLRGKSKTELRDHYRQVWCGQPTVFDPIPSEFRPTTWEKQ